MRPRGQLAAPRRDEGNFDRSLVRAFRLQFPRRTAGDDLARVDDGHAIAEPLRLFDVVRRHHDRSFLGAQFLDQIANFQPHLRIEAAGRLVEKKHLRIVDQREGDREPLLLPAGERGVSRVLFFPKLQTFEQSVAVHGAGVERAEKFQGFLHRNFVGQIGRLQADADSVFQLLLLPIRIEIEHLHLAGGARTQAFQDFDRARLAGAVGAEQSKNFTGPHFEIDAFNRFEISVGLPQPADVDGKFVIGGHANGLDD